MALIGIEINSETLNPDAYNISSIADNLTPKSDLSLFTISSNFNISDSVSIFGRDFNVLVLKYF